MNQITTKKLITFLFFSIIQYAALGQITGSVFRDFNGNGTKDTNEPLVSGITVNAYGTTGALCGTATSAGNTAPNYSLSGCGTGAVRIEFVLPTSGICAKSGIDFSALSGTTYGSSIQFVNGNSTNVNFALHNPDDYNTGAANTMAFIPCYTAGDPLAAGGTSGSDDWFVGFPYNNSGTTVPTQKMNGTKIGAVWGVAYSKQANKIFTSAFIKRHVGLGELGSGGIYLLTPTATSFTASSFFDMDNPSNALLATSSSVSAAPTRCSSGCPNFGLGTSYSTPNRGTVTFLGSTDPITGQPAGLGVVGTNTQRGLVGNKTTPSRDPSAMDQVGKVGLGDIDISDDGKYLFVTNLYDRKIYRLELNDAANPTSVVSITSYALPSVSVTNGVLRPFGLKYTRGKVYVGAVASGETESTNTNTNLYAYVFELNDATASASFSSSSIITPHQLNYTRGSANSGTANLNKWYPWSKSGENFITLGYPTPMLTDIDFTDRGDLLLAFTDRTGHQYGHQNYRFTLDPGYGDLVTTQIAGDLLVAGINCSAGSYSMESNGSFSSNGQTFSGGTGNTQGPGGGEFFDEENQNTTHTETSQGAIAVLKGTGRVMLTNMNPTTTTFSGGTKLMSTSDGSATNGYTLYNQNTAGEFGKANGLGDIEFQIPPSPIEIGNRVWEDTDQDGIQDAGEPALSGVTVTLCLASAPATPVATATTDANGNYYFSSATGTSTSSVKYGVNILDNTDYILKFPTTSGALSLTTANTGTNNLIDSDAGSNGQIAFTTGEAGQNDHSFDVGYSASSCATPTPTGTPAERCGNGTVTLGASGCTTGYSATWYSDAGLTTQVGTGNSFTTPSLSATTTYYVACVETASPTCKSSGVSVIATIKPNPTISAGTPVCNGAGTQFEVPYTASAGATVTASIGTVDATNSKVTGVPSGQTVTITATLNGCTATATATQNCASPCNAPTPTGTPAERCGNGTVTIGASGCTTGFTATWYSDAGLTTQVGTGNSFTTPSLSATTTYYVACVEDATPTCKSSGVSVIATIKPNPTISAGTPVCNGAGTQFEVPYTASAGATVTASIGTVDAANSKVTGVSSGQTVTITATLNGCTATTTATQNCASPCTPPNAGPDITICLPKTTLDLIDAPTGTAWSVGAGNPATATIDAVTGKITGLTVSGTYTFVLTNTSDANCKDEVKIIVTPGDTPIVLCNDGSTSYTLIAQSGLINVVWYSMDGTQVGTGSSLIVTSNTGGLADGSEAYYYIGQDGTASGCDVELCCPVKFITQSCCPTPNCVNITVIKN